MIIGVCDAETSLEWLSVLFVYKGIVLLAGLFVAFEARKVNLISLNESRFIAMSIYGAIIVSIALTPIGLLLENFPNAQYGIMGIMIILSVTIILGLVFVSKVHTHTHIHTRACMHTLTHTHVNTTHNTHIYTYVNMCNTHTCTYLCVNIVDVQIV